MQSRIRAEDVVVGEYVAEAQLLDLLGVGADRAAVSADLGLRENNACLHGCLST
jgi:hypothetical protein